MLFPISCARRLISCATMRFSCTTMRKKNAAFVKTTHVIALATLVFALAMLTSLFATLVPAIQNRKPAISSHVIVRLKQGNYVTDFRSVLLLFIPTFQINKKDSIAWPRRSDKGTSIFSILVFRKLPCSLHDKALSKTLI